MPISHLLSESFYQEKEEQRRGQNEQDNLIVSLSSDSYQTQTGCSRRVRFTDLPEPLKHAHYYGFTEPDHAHSHSHPHQKVFANEYHHHQQDLRILHQPALVSSLSTCHILVGCSGHSWASSFTQVGKNAVIFGKYFCKLQTRKISCHHDFGVGCAMRILKFL